MTAAKATTKAEARPKAEARRAKTRAPRRRRATKGGAAPVPSASHRAAWLGGIAIVLAAAFHVWTGVRVVSLGYERSQAIELRQRLTNQRDVLADELASLLRTEHLELESQRRLGLGPPSAGQVVDLRTKQMALATRRQP